MRWFATTAFSATQCWNSVVTMRNKVVTMLQPLRCAWNRRCESSHVTSPLGPLYIGVGTPGRWGNPPVYVISHIVTPSTPQKFTDIWQIERHERRRGKGRQISGERKRGDSRGRRKNCRVPIFSPHFRQPRGTTIKWQLTSSSEGSSFLVSFCEGCEPRQNQRKEKKHILYLISLLLPRALN